ncbi:MAG: hypothetical protein H0T43_08330, partial [Solirubrobacterales bacterium]|nr:hypothetical protein [Solirubrobacterales bacterium]
MSERPGLSRRGLFSFGLSRLVTEVDEQPPVPPVVPPPAPADLGEQADRLRAAWGRSDGMGLWAGASS